MLGTKLLLGITLMIRVASCVAIEYILEKKKDAKREGEG